jgi:hypothetical protein
MTKKQEEYIEDIEINLKIAFNLEPTRKNADIFIKQHKEANDKYKKEHDIKNHMSKAQRQMIAKIEKEFGVKFKGWSYDEAYKFIDEYYIDIKSKETEYDKMKRYMVWRSNHLNKGKKK